MITILPSARKDLASGFAFYESQEPGLGSYFMDSLFAEIDSLELYAGIHPAVFNYYRFLSKRFPYAVYYSMEAGTVLVKAVLDCRRDPAFIRRQLER
jgi:hypothetical protein